MFPVFSFGQITPEIISFLDLSDDYLDTYEEELRYLSNEISNQLMNSKMLFSESTELSFLQAIKEASTFENIKEGWTSSETVDKVLPIHKFLFLKDNHGFRDNAMTVFSIIKFTDKFEYRGTSSSNNYSDDSKNCNDIENNYIQIIKSDKDPLKLFFNFQAGDKTNNQANPHFYRSIGSVTGSTRYESLIESISFIFNNDNSTVIKFNNDEIHLTFEDDNIPEKGRICFGVNADIKPLLTSLMSYSKADIKIEYKDRNDGNNLKSAYAILNLNGAISAINKIQGNYLPTTKNSGYIYKMGLVNSNPFDLEKYVDKFILDAKINHGLDFSYVNNNERLIIFRQLEGEAIALAYEMNNDKKVLILVDPENWNNANQSLRYYIIYHELGHDILNLEHGEGGRMMNPYKEGQFSWSRFEIDKTEMFNKYKVRNNINETKSSKSNINSYSLDVNSQNTSSIVIGSFGAMSNAERQKQTLIKEGFDNIDISKVGNIYRVSVLVSGSKEKVQEVHKRVKVYHKSAWISYN
jgi:hypothetical protein